MLNRVHNNYSHFIHLTFHKDLLCASGFHGGQSLAGKPVVTNTLKGAPHFP